MKVVFRTYTKKDNSPEDGYWAVLQHLEGLKEKDILVRIDIDKKNQLGYDEVDIFCPSLKITNLKLKNIEGNKFEAEFDTKDLRAVFSVLINMAGAGNGGHSYEALIGKQSFFIDGDGADHIESINGVKVTGKICGDRSKWADIYNKKENEDESMKFTEDDINEMVTEAVNKLRRITQYMI